MALDRETVRAVLDFLGPVDGSDFYHNESNDYGAVTLKWFSGAGNPWDLFRGAEVQGTYAVRGGGSEVRGTGRYALNDAAVDALITAIQDRRAGG